MQVPDDVFSRKGRRLREPTYNNGTMIVGKGLFTLDLSGPSAIVCPATRGTTNKSAMSYALTDRGEANGKSASAGNNDQGWRVPRGL